MNSSIKFLSALVLFCGLVVLFFLGLGSVSLNEPVGSENKVEKIAGNIGFYFSVIFAICLASLVAGVALVFRGRKLASQRCQEDIRSANEKVVKVMPTVIISIAMFAGLVVLAIWYSLRWNPDTAWAARVIGEADELQALLARYHEANGEYPMSLLDLEDNYTEPTNFMSRNAESQGMGCWGYERIGTDHYQLEVTAYSWVSYWDSLVYRSSSDFAEPWFDNCENTDWLDFGKWRYVKGFSSYRDQYYFDAKGNLQQR